jgi:hypothetical protein
MSKQDHLRNSVLAIHGPESTNHQRLEAMQAIAAALDTPELDIAMDLFLSDQIPIQHFGLQMIDSLIAKADDWTTKQAATRLLTPKPILIQQKIAQVFARAVKRLWPLAWLEMNHLLLTYHMSGGRIQSCLIWKAMSDDIFVYHDELALARKKELTTSIISICLNQPQVDSIINSGDVPDLETLVKLTRADMGSLGWLHILFQELLVPDLAMEHEFILEALGSIVGWVPVWYISLM